MTEEDARKTIALAREEYDGDDSLECEEDRMYRFREWADELLKAAELFRDDYDFVMTAIEEAGQTPGG